MQMPMKSVDLLLREVPKFSGWDRFVRLAYICHDREKTLRGDHRDLFFFPDLDYFYHQHRDGIYYRTFAIVESGTVRIGGSDSERENVIQRHAIQLDGKGNYHHIGTLEDLKVSSERFFKSMQQQNRKVSNTDVRIRFR